ncbi:polysaccharide lyase family 7 protein [Thalassotalea hakodatensis]|uniref:polysaccharide lyase family 7 protein n=1 Tax=Thalassotalea hakodatensis TaxID=3030492 RepID=UPI002572889B|nr:polysaccharide lyase family 7 protein [Thalassotalea hakodatensis]
MKKQKILLTLFTSAFLFSCGGSSTAKNTQAIPKTPEEDQTTTPTVIDDITCDVSYPLDIASISYEGGAQSIASLHDGSKINDSSWQPNTLDTNVLITLAEPALLKQLVITWANTEYANLFSISSSKDNKNWQLLNTVTESEIQTIIPDVVDLAQSPHEQQTALYLNLALSGNQVSQASTLLEIEVYGCRETTAHSIELIDWYLSVPTDDDNNGKSDSIKEQDLAAGYYDPRFFTLTHDSGLRFSTSVSGYKTSNNTSYVRAELREMLRRGDASINTQGVNKNNWVFSTAPDSDLSKSGGIDGTLSAQLAVNHVTTTGENYQIGRVIIGQIHANDDEPVRLYYRKLPENQNGAIYLAHEKLGGDDYYYELIGSRGNNASNPSNGIALNEKFSYTIEVQGNNLNVTVIKSDGTEFHQHVDMSQSGYDVGNQYMYFKAGVYNQNNSGDPHDYVQATFYQIDNHHNTY